MEDIRTAVKLLTKDCYMCTIDLKDAYFMVPISKVSKKFLRFKFQNQTYEFQCLPFGLSLAPFVFTKLMKPVMTTLREQGLLLVIYLDDILCIGNTYNECLRCVSDTLLLLENLGFIVNYTKSKLKPNKTQIFLGFELDSHDMCLKLPQDKRQKILHTIEKLSLSKSLTIRDFASFVGLLTSVCPAVAYGWVYTKHFERVKYLALQEANENYDEVIQLPSYLQNDFLWWKNNIMSTNNSIRRGHYTLEIFSDASLTGWGIFCNGERSHGFWDTTESVQHINLLELKAAFIGLQCFTNDLRNQEILLRIDNTTAISYINRSGGVQHTHLNDISRKMWQWCEKRQLFIFASYIRSKDNIEADEESRQFNIDTEWSLCPKAYNTIINTFGKPNIDLFATRLNSKCDIYVSWKRDPQAFQIDAFTVNWSNHFFYAFPPFSIILKCLRKIINDKAVGIMVVPHWPNQPWYPLYMKLAVYAPINLGPNPQLLLSPSRTQHPLWKQLTLVACLLSGQHSQNNY